MLQKLKSKIQKSMVQKLFFMTGALMTESQLVNKLLMMKIECSSSSFDNYDVILGQGTAALQAINNLQEKEKNSQQKFDAAIICTSGGGLAAGSGTVLKSHNAACSLYTAEPHDWNDHEKSFEAKRKVYY